MDYAERLEKVAVLGAAGKMGSGITLLMAMEMADLALQPAHRARRFVLHAVDVTDEALAGLVRYLADQARKSAEMRAIALAALACALLATACSNPCQELGDRLCDCRAAGTTKAACSQQVAADLDRLSGVSLVLTADVTGLEVGTHSVAVSANLATGLTLVGASPNPVEVTVSSPAASPG